MTSSEVPTGIRSLSHTITWGINLAMFTNMIQFMYLQAAPARSGIHSYGPRLMMVASMVLTMADLTRHILLDADVSNLYMYQQNPETGETELTTVGLAGVICTWLGVSFMLVSIAWFTDIIGKVKKSYRKATEMLHEDEEREEFLLPLRGGA